MIRLDYSCGDCIVEIECDRDNIPDAIVCPVTGDKAVRSWDAMNIRSKTYVGTGGGRDMIQKRDQDVISVGTEWSEWQADN